MGLFSNYNSAGPGVPKAPQEKIGLFKFMEVYGRRMWVLMGLNLIYLLACIPIVTFGPATAGMTKVARNFSQERHAFVWHDFWQAFKKNFKQSFIMGLIDILFVVAFIVAVPSYSVWAKQNQMMYIPFVLCLMCVIVFFMMHFYIYLMIASTTLPLIKILRNAFFLVPLGLKQSIFTFLNWIWVIALVVLLYPYSIFILPIWPLTFLCFVTAFNCDPVIRKFVIQPYYDQRGEENPEFDYLKKKDDEQVFADNPELDKPVEKKKQVKKKGKTIS